MMMMMMMMINDDYDVDDDYYDNDDSHMWFKEGLNYPLPGAWIILVQVF
jgi:hypothetical protein